MTTAGHAIEQGNTQAEGVSSARRFSGSLGRLLGRWRNLLRFHLVPEGYEDEKGFHYGKPPHPNCVNLDQYAGSPAERKIFGETRTVAANADRPKTVPTSVTLSHSFVPARKK